MEGKASSRKRSKDPESAPPEKGEREQKSGANEVDVNTTGNEVEVLRLRNEQLILENKKLELEMKKLELETAAKKLELKLANRTASETPKTPGSAVKMHKMEKTHSSKDISLTSLDGVSVKIEPGTEGFLKGPRDDVESIDSGSDDGEWTEVKSKARKAKGSSVFTTGEQSDWVRTKFALMIPMDSLGVMSWKEQLKVG